MLPHAGVGVALWRKEGCADDMTHGSSVVASWAGSGEWKLRGMKFLFETMKMV